MRAWPFFPTGASICRVFEDSLPKETVASLRAILEAQALKELKGDQRSAFAAATKGAALFAVIPRAQTTQGFSFVELEGNVGVPSIRFPESLRPLIQWIESTTEMIHRRKLHPVKGAKPENCWLAPPR